MSYFNWAAKITGGHQLKNKLLRVERPNKPVQQYWWDDDSKRRFYLVDDEIEHLESGKVLWRGLTALSLEDKLELD